MAQPMGEYTLECLNSQYAWGFCQLDLTGPFHCRGIVNSRQTKKILSMFGSSVGENLENVDFFN